MPRTVPTKPTAGMAHTAKRIMESSASRREASSSHSSRAASAACCTLRVAAKRVMLMRSVRGSSRVCTGAGNCSN
jgi:hypothetical protein